MHQFTENRSTTISLWSAALLLALSINVPSAHALIPAAATITVNSTADNVTGGDGLCTLREAINNANANADITSGDCVAGAGADTIVLPAGTYTITIFGPGEDLNASGDFDATDGFGIIIQGAGAASTIIDGGGFDRVLHALSGQITIDGVTIRNGSVTGAANTDEFGGGIYALGNASITNSTISGNTVTSGGSITLPWVGYGGGLAVIGTATITNSTISGNSAIGSYAYGSGRGGGVYAGPAASATIANSTISANSATGYNSSGSLGGGVYAASGATVTNCTFSGNSSYFGGALSSSGAGPTLTVSHTIFDANTADPAGFGYDGGNCGPWATYASGGYNIDHDGSCAFAGTGDLVANPMIGPLADNGGGTWTHALLAGSPAIDIYTMASCAMGIDQRGVTRPQGIGCDSGAFEADQTAPVITLNGISPVNVEVGSAYVDAGATVTDNVDAAINNLAGISTVYTAVPGSYAVIYIYTDAAGNAATPVVRLVNVVDTTVPVITVPNNITVAATSPSGVAASDANMAAFLAGAIATDNVAVTSLINDAPATFPVGVTTVAFTASDAAGNSAAASATVTVTPYFQKVAGSGGGCVAGSVEQPDSSMLVMLVLLAGIRWMRRRRE